MSAGRWTGEIDKWIVGDVILNVDENPSFGLTGYAYFLASDLPIAACIHLDGRQQFDGTKFQVSVIYFDPKFGTIFDRSNNYLENEFPDFWFPEWVDFSVALDEPDVLKCRLFNLGGQEIDIAFSLQREKLAEFSTIASTEIGWSDFKTRVNSSPSGAHLFRGQAAPWPLQSTFHRSTRNCLHRFNDFDVPQLHRATSAFTRHVFRLEQPEERGALVALAQHHGYPTPLIDWSMSPYVAAWFAFQKIRVNDDLEGRPVRILMLDRTALDRFAKNNLLTLTYPHINVSTHYCAGGFGNRKPTLVSATRHIDFD